MFFSCDDRQYDYTKIEKIESSFVPFGINTPIELGEDVVNISPNTIQISDQTKLLEIGLLLSTLKPETMKENQVKSNVYVKSLISLKTNNKTVELYSDKQLILLDNKAYKYSEELINKIRGL